MRRVMPLRVALLCYCMYTLQTQDTGCRWDRQSAGGVGQTQLWNGVLNVPQLSARLSATLKDNCPTGQEVDRKCGGSSLGLPWGTSWKKQTLGSASQDQPCLPPKPGHEAVGRGGSADVTTHFILVPYIRLKQTPQQYTEQKWGE